MVQHSTSPSKVVGTLISFSEVVQKSNIRNLLQPLFAIFFSPSFIIILFFTICFYMDYYISPTLHFVCKHGWFELEDATMVSASPSWVYTKPWSHTSNALSHKLRLSNTLFVNLCKLLLLNYCLSYIITFFIRLILLKYLNHFNPLSLSQIFCYKPFMQFPLHCLAMIIIY